MATSAFGKAFREARAAGDKTFTFNGKKYTTELAPEEQKSVGGKPKLDEYVPRDSDTRKGEIMTSKNTVPRDSFARKQRIEERAMRDANASPAGSEYTSTEDFMGMKDMAKKSEYEKDEKMGGVHGGYKRGGSVKASKMGSVRTSKPSMSSASSRGDGIASRGKTRGRMV